MGATLGATDTNDFSIVWTYPDSRQGRARGHGLIWTGSDARTGIYGSDGIASGGASGSRMDREVQERPLSVFG